MSLLFSPQCNTDALVQLGFTELGLNDLPAARSAFSQALSIAPAYTDATFGLPRSSSEPAICPNPPICTPLYAKALHSSEDALHPRTATFQCRQIVLERRSRPVRVIGVGTVAEALRTELTLLPPDALNLCRCSGDS